jgi:hypothetical protein
MVHYRVLQEDKPTTDKVLVAAVGKVVFRALCPIS